jgi:hypothetical protein
METKISAHNSSDIALDKNQLFSGKIDDISMYNHLVIIINADQNSAETGINLDFTDDKESWVCKKFSYKNNGEISKTFPIKSKYFKISYINGNTRYFSELTELSTNFRLTADIDGNSDYIVISCQAVKGVAKNAFVSLRWMEII